MKKIMLINIMFFTTCITNAQILKAEIVATGLTCSMCSNAIQKQLKALNEADSVNTDLNSNTFTVYLKKENSLTPKALKDRVEKAGFFIGSMIITMPFDNLKVEINTKAGNYIFIDAKPQTLNGPTKVKVLDKGFVTAKEYKKLLKTYSKSPTYVLENEEDFHLKIQ